jgi:hypothetical protein
MKTISEMTDILKLANDGKSIRNAENDNGNKVELYICKIFTANGFIRQNPEKIYPSTEDIHREYHKQTGKDYIDGRKIKSSISKEELLFQSTLCKEIKKSLTKVSIDLLKQNHFYYQPYGTQNSPDIIAKDFNGSLLEVESKSGTTIMFNSGILHSTYYYMCEYTTGEVKRGYCSDIFDPEAEEIIKLAREEFEEHNKNSLLRLKNKMSLSEQQLIKLESWTSSGIYARAMLPGISSTNSIWLDITKEKLK